MAVSELIGSFLGSGRLLIECAEIWQAGGNKIRSVVSDCPHVSAWALSNGIERLSVERNQAEGLGREPFDYLFSIINHAITSAEVLALPRRMAINYHDSALPRYAGFNATTWAILDGQPTHAVTWHEMTAAVDGGRILLQEPIEIRDDDTAFSLGARCMQTGVSSFRMLVAMLAAADRDGVAIDGRPQGPQQDFHVRSARPGLGVIDLAAPAATISAFVRALDMGSDDNWMCRPKLALPSGLHIAGEVTILPKTAHAPGTVFAADARGLTIAGADAALRFSGITSLDGEPVEPSSLNLAVGAVLPQPSRDAVMAAAALDQIHTKNERFWVRRLAGARAPDFADLRAHAGPVEAAVERRTLPAALAQAPALQRLEAAIAALAAYVARTGETGGFDLGFSHEPDAALMDAYSSVTPLHLDVDLSVGFGDLQAVVGRELKTQERRGLYARDVVTRYAALKGNPAPSLPIGVRLEATDGFAPALAPGAHLTLAVAREGGDIAWIYDRAAIGEAAVRAIADRIDVMLAEGAAAPARPLAELDLLPAAERKALTTDWQDTAKPFDETHCIHEMFEAQADRTPDAVAVAFGRKSLTYRDLDQRANRVAEALRERGVGPDQLVAVSMERSLDMIVGLMGVLKAGGAYVPVDPAYPRERVSMMIEDADPRVILTQARLADQFDSRGAQILSIETLGKGVSDTRPRSGVKPADLAYTIFTSGSTGRPKGVMVSHRNVANFFTGMDDAIGVDPGVWLAVTSISFDISVLELFWTLARGFTVVIQAESDRATLSREAEVKATRTPMDFGLFYFAAEQGGSSDPYKLMIEGAKFADAHDFTAVWTPERHFHEFGGLYPNPAVTTAALATITKRVALRAGSVVLPLHSPIRVAEDWAVVDQLSGGRVALSFASGWHANDFALMPQNFARRREILDESADTVKRLWRGETIQTPNGNGDMISLRTLPRPIQAQPPIWIASAGSIETFKHAGEMGWNVLTNMLGQDLADLTTKFAAYRKAWDDAGHPGRGVVTVMLHTYVCEDTEKARRLARKPFCDYLTSAYDLIKVAPSMFPAFKQPSVEAGKAAGHFDASAFTAEDLEALLDYAFDRYFETAGLFGTPERALGMIEQLKSIGANEVACLIDFGLASEDVLDGLNHLDRLRRLANPAAADEDAEAAAEISISEQIRTWGVTHLQCTPSMARMLADDPQTLASLGGLKKVLLGGEALPDDLVAQLHGAGPVQILNMYGPTETTIWSTHAPVKRGAPITIGQPIANTTIRILDPRGRPTPVGVAGELCIGGAGVVRGYLGRPDLTAERFVADPLADGETIYRTGDLARYLPSGEIDFLGRLDSQVKVNGYRIELGEIETQLSRHPSVRQNVVVARTDSGRPELVAYVIPASGATDGENNEELVSRWEGLWDGAYRQAGEVADPRFNIAGWSDSFTGAPIPAEEMREWLDGVEASVMSLAPRRVLEIGCGTGMVLYRVAPKVEHYTAVDISAHALEAIRAELTADEAARVSLLQRPAHDLHGLEDGSFDTVIINSVAQYFPDADYLQRVLARAVELVADGGQVFVGDVRDRETLDAFCTRVALDQSAANMDKDAVLARAQKRMAQDSELVVAEGFFQALKRSTPRIGAVDVQLKRSKARNEMTCFRYDVVLHVGPAATEATAPAGVTFNGLADLRAALAARPPVLVAEDLVNARVSGLYAARTAMAGAATMSAEDLRDLASGGGGVDPAEVADLDADYLVDLVPARSGRKDAFDAIFRHRTAGPAGRLAARRPTFDGAPETYVNQPAAGGGQKSKVVENLRAHLKDRIPDYMLPAKYVLLETFPLTPNGKIDRKALPAPVTEAAASAVDFAPPSNDLEERIAAIWRDLLNLERVGRKDNIFDLGANSLLTAQANQRLSVELNRKVSLVSMFRYPTVEMLAANLDDRPAPGAVQDVKRTQERADRVRDAAERRRELREAMGSR